VTAAAGVVVAALLGVRAAATPPLPMPVPESVTFWNAREGLILLRSERCPSDCPGALARTVDGARTWTLLPRPAEPGEVAAVPGTSVAYVTGPDGLLRTADRGVTWHLVTRRRLTHVAFGSARTGWGLASASIYDPGPLRRTVDGGRTWTARANPCRGALAFDERLAASTARVVWTLCLGQPSAGSQRKGLFRSADAGRTWRRLPAAGLDASGYGAGLAFRPSGRGWLWEARGPLLTTADGGRSWRVLPISAPEEVEGRSLSFVTDRVGYGVFVYGTTLRRSADGGEHWTTLRRWPR